MWANPHETARIRAVSTPQNIFFKLRVSTNLENLGKSGNWKFVWKIREKSGNLSRKWSSQGNVREFLSLQLPNVSVQSYPGSTSISFLTWLQIVLLCLCGCCHYCKQYLKCLSSNDRLIIFFVSSLIIPDINKREPASKKKNS